MNRSVMEGNPHSVIEGLMIAARAIGANETLVYVRAEYPLAVERMRRAVADAEREGILGNNVLAPASRMKCDVMEGAGAFVCGEETAMIASIEGPRGMPRPSRHSRRKADCGASRPSSTTLKRWPMFRASSTKAPRPSAASAPRSRRAPRPLRSPATWPTPAWLKFPSEPTLREIVLNIGGGITDDAASR
jgi:NADH-quinone oxidoreductase subunit F